MSTEIKTRNFAIYDWNNNEKIVTIEDKPIEAIIINVVSGDETAYIYYEDGTEEYIDSSNKRLESYLDETYLIKKNEVENWINFKFRIQAPENKKRNYAIKSAERAAYFTKERYAKLFK